MKEQFFTAFLLVATALSLTFQGHGLGNGMAGKVKTDTNFIILADFYGTENIAR